MKVEIQYSEFHDIVAKAAKKDLILEYVSENSCSANVSLPTVPFLNRPMSASLTINIDKVEGNALFITLGGFPGIEMVLPMALGAIENQLPEGLSVGFIEKVGGASVILHLDRIEKIRRILEKFTFQSISFSHEAIVITASLINN